MVLVKDNFFKTTHGKIECITCHKGDKDKYEKDKAHKNIIAFPSEELEESCGGCHGEIMSNFKTGLHFTLSGYLKRIENRLGYSIADNPDLMEHFNNECYKCHASCGQCHISRPASVNGGFLKGHVFQKKPSQLLNCTACHGSRVGNEYLGQNEGYKADVHRIPLAKQCTDCHTDREMHSSGNLATHRYQDRDMVRCENCHLNAKDKNKYHKAHWGNSSNPELSCQVCHSQPYKNCNACHTGGEGITGSSYFTFKIAKNYLKSPDRNYDYITVRHIPIIQDTYKSWGISDLPDFSSEPTWKYTTPHNIQRWTPQTDTTGTEGSCFAKCHNSNYYLTEEDLKNYEKDANKNIIMKIK